MEKNKFQRGLGFLSLATLTLAFGFAWNVEAQGETKTPPPTAPAITVATVNLQNASVIKQTGNFFTIGFTLSNRVGVQPKVIYGVNLIKIDGDTQSNVDQKIYDNDIVNLGENTSIVKEISYTAPAYLNGTYTLMLEARSPDGLIFAMTPLATKINLTGVGGQITLNEANCFLTVNGEKVSKKYSLTQGVDIAETEVLTLHCPIASSYQTNQTVTPNVEIRHRSTFGKIIKSEKLPSIVVSAGKKSDVTFTLPQVNIPQAYEAILSLVDTTNQSVSTSITAHFVLRGESATIQNLTLDKDFYKEGDTANVSFFWSGSADNFDGSRIARADSKKMISAVFTITDAHKILCAESTTKSLPLNIQSSDEHLSIPIKNSCQNPTISAKIVDQYGKVLAENSYAVTSKNIPATTPTTSTNKTASSTIIFVIIALIILIGASGLGFYIAHKNKQPTIIALFFGIVSVVGLLSSAPEAKADTFSIASGAVYITVGLNKNDYTPGETIIVTASSVITTCTNNVMAASLSGTINGGTQMVLRRPILLGVEDAYRNDYGTAYFTAPMTAGNYNASFTGAGTVRTISVAAGYAPFSTSINIPYTVLGGGAGKDAPVITAPETKAVSLTLYDTRILINKTTSLRWVPVGTFTTCQATGNWNGNKNVAGGTEEIGPYSTPGTYKFNLGCFGATGSSYATEQTLTVVNPPPVNGVCGPSNGILSRRSPTTGFCGGTSAAGHSPITRNTKLNRWEWKCLGQYDGTNASCATKEEPDVKFNPI